MSYSDGYKVRRHIFSKGSDTLPMFLFDQVLIMRNILAL